MKKYIIVTLAALMFIGASSANDYIIQDSSEDPLFVVNNTGEKQVYNGELDMNGNSISSVGGLELGWGNLTDYPLGCGSNEAVQVVGDTLDCTSLNPGGTVETAGGAKGQVAYFVDGENITGSNNFYWNNSQVELGIGTNNPSATLDVNGDAEINQGLDMASSAITGISDLGGTGIVNNNQISDGAVTSNKIGSQEVTSNELSTGVAGTGLSGGAGSSLSVNTDTGLTTSGDNILINTAIVPRKGEDETVTASQWTYENDVQVQGNLDVWGNITNTDVENLNINGSLLPPSGYSDTFDVGSTSRRWRTGYFQDMVLGSNVIDNSELANSGLSINTNAGIDSSSVNLGGTLTINHATSSITDTSNSDGQVIQDLTFDNFGHVDTLSTTDLDNRYYTETESDDNFVDESGDTMTGNLDMNQNTIYLDQSRSNPWSFYTRSINNDMVLTRSGTSGAEIRYDVGADTLRIGANSAGASLSLANGDLNMNSNSITNFFGSNCLSDEVVESVNADGTYNCQSITGASDDTYVNEAGDTMTGNLDMDGNNIQNAGTVNASQLKKNGNSVTSLFLDESGDAMTGQINMQGNPLNNVGTIDMNSQGQIQTDGTNAITIDSNQNLDIPNGNLGIGGGDINSVRRINGDSGNHRIRFDSSSDWIEFTDQSNSRQEIVTQDTFINEDGFWLGDENLVNISADGGLSGGGSRGLTDSVSISHADTSSVGDTSNSDGRVIQDITFDGFGHVQTLAATDLDSRYYTRSESDDNFVDESGDTMTGNLDMGGNDVGNVGTVAQASSVLGLDVDSGQYQSNSLVTKTPNEVTLGYDSNNNGAGSFQVVKNISSLDASSGAIEQFRVQNNGNVEIPNGNLNMNNNIITGVSSPSNSDDAVPKSYVDSATEGATQTLNEVLSEGNDASSQAILNIGSGDIDVDRSGLGNIQLNTNNIRGGNITQSNNLIAGSFATGESEVDGGDIWVENDVEVGGDIVGSGADVAENVQNESDLEPGTVVQISGNMSVDKTDGKHDTQVAGVVSTDPAMIMAKERDGVPVAMTGTAPVKVTVENGEIKPGDMLTTSSKPGKAMKCNDMERCTGSVIGKAMEPAKKSSEIDMLISMS